VGKRGLGIVAREWAERLSFEPEGRWQIPGCFVATRLGVGAWGRLGAGATRYWRPSGLH